MHAAFLQKLELLFARFISKQLEGTLGFLLHEVYLENGHYLKGKLMFSCSSFAEIGARICKFLSKKLGETLTFFCMNYTWRMQIIGKAIELLHADVFAEIGALICKVYKQAIGRNTWLSFA